LATAADLGESGQLIAEQLAAILVMDWDGPLAVAFADQDEGGLFAAVAAADQDEDGPFGAAGYARSAAPNVWCLFPAAAAAEEAAASSATASNHAIKWIGQAFGDALLQAAQLQREGSDSESGEFVDDYADCGHMLGALPAVNGVNACTMGRDGDCRLLVADTCGAVLPGMYRNTPVAVRLLTADSWGDTLDVLQDKLMHEVQLHVSSEAEHKQVMCQWLSGFCCQMLQPRPCVVTASEVAFCSTIWHVF